MKDEHYIIPSDNNKMDLFEVAFSYLKEEKLSKY
jgi:hypothetical protein